MDLMKGKKGLIMGVANERSIAWGISQKLAEAGAELAFTYLGDALKKRVIPLAEKLNSKVTFSCDVEKKEEVIKLFEDIHCFLIQRVVKIKKYKKQHYQDGNQNLIIIGQIYIKIILALLAQGLKKMKLLNLLSLV